MAGSLKIPVEYKGEIEFDAKLIPFCYTHRFVVDVEGIEVYFEPDEERQCRAIISQDALEKNLTPNIELHEIQTKR